MKRCIYAGDPEDEYCKNCDGLTTTNNKGDSIPCTECAGYEAGEEVKEEQPEPPKPETIEEMVQPLSELASKASADDNSVESSKTSAKASQTKSKPKISIVDNDAYAVKSIRYSSGVTFMRNDVYYKLMAEEEWELKPDATEDEIEDAKEKLWAKINSMVDFQVDEIDKLYAAKALKDANEGAK